MRSRLSLLSAAVLLYSLGFVFDVQAVVCAKVKVNLQGTPAGTAITVSSTAIQVAISNPQKARCYLVIQNPSANAMNCMSDVQGTPTATIGIPIPGGQQIRFDVEGQEAFSCIRSTGSDATAVVIEGLP